MNYQNFERSIHEECGIIGIISPEKKNIARDIYYGLFALQHRGQESAGIAVHSIGRTNKNSIEYYKGMGLVGEVFTNGILSSIPESRVGIGHNRYSTTGGSHLVNAQPVVFYGRRGRMAFAHNGNIANVFSLKEDLIKKGHSFLSSTDSEVMASLINFHCTDDEKDGILNGIINATKKVKGAYAIVLTAEEKLYAMRDPLGLKPLVMGRRGNDIVFASESCALLAMNATVERDIYPGEIVRVGVDGKIETFQAYNEPRRSCIFEYVYLASPGSLIDGVSVHDSRFNCGVKLAKLYKIDADIVAGVPDSANPSAQGYSKESGILYGDVLIKNRYIGRTFIQPQQKQREESIHKKFTVYPQNVKGKRIILIDDSIVRGNTCRQIIKMLRCYGAKEVHMFSASPPVKFPCYFGVDIDNKRQLIGAEKSIDEIRQEIGADSLHYIPLECMEDVCGKRGTFCTACFSGNYPFDAQKYLSGKDGLECC